MAGRKKIGTESIQVRMLPLPNLIKEVRDYAKKRTNQILKKDSKENQYKVLVWFRFISAGEIEKDFEIHYTSALSQEDAKRKVTIEHYSGHSAIPFKYEVNEIREQIDEQIAQEI